MAFLDLHTFLVSPLVPEVRLYLFLGEDIHYELRPNKNRVVEPFCTSSLTSLNVLRSFFRPFKENARTPRLCLYCRDDWEMSCRSLLQHKSAMRVISPQICFLYLTFRFMLTSHGKGSVGKENLPDSSWGIRPYPCDRSSCEAVKVDIFKILMPKTVSKLVVGRLR